MGVGEGDWPGGSARKGSLAGKTAGGEREACATADWRAGGLRVRGCAGSVWEGVGSSSSSSTQHDAEGGSGGEGERKRVAAVVWCGVGEGWCR